MPYKAISQQLRERKKISDREYNHRRPLRHKVYNTARWQKLREYKKQRNPLCEECLRHGRITPMSLVDHIVPIEAGGAVFDLTNLQSLCSACHNAKHSRVEGG